MSRIDESARTVHLYRIVSIISQPSTAPSTPAPSTPRTHAADEQVFVLALQYVRLYHLLCQAFDESPFVMNDDDEVTDIDVAADSSTGDGSDQSGVDEEHGTSNADRDEEDDKSTDDEAEARRVPTETFSDVFRIPPVMAYGLLFRERLPHFEPVVYVRGNGSNHNLSCYCHLECCMMHLIIIVFHSASKRFNIALEYVGEVAMDRHRAEAAHAFHRAMFREIVGSRCVQCSLR